MTNDELKQLYRLMTKWIFQPNWNKDSPAWNTIVQARRQVLIDLHEAGITEEEAEKE